VHESGLYGTCKYCKYETALSFRHLCSPPTGGIAIRRLFVCWFVNIRPPAAGAGGGMRAPGGGYVLVIAAIVLCIPVGLHLHRCCHGVMEGFWGRTPISSRG